MAKKVLVIPDIHGETFWKEPAQKYIDQVDRIVFLGDYVDPYEEEGIDGDAALGCFFDVLDLKAKNPEKVVLLLGNHDLHYLNAAMEGGRLDYSRKDLRLLLDPLSISLANYFFYLNFLVINFHLKKMMME